MYFQGLFVAWHGEWKALHPLPAIAIATAIANNPETLFCGIW